MAVYTTITTEEANKILAEYDLGTLKDVPVPVEKGNNNSIFMMHTTKGDYVLKIYEPSIDPFVVTTLQERHDLQRFCFDKGIPVPELIGSLGTFKGQAFEIAHEIDGTHPFPLTPEQAFEIGKMLAGFHVKASEFPHFKNKLPPSPLKMLGSEIMGSIRRTMQNGDLSAEFRYASLISSAVAEKMVALFSMPKLNLPTGKIHGDVNRDNIMLDTSGRFHLLDLERTNEGVLIADIAQGIVRMCSHKKDTGQNGYAGQNGFHHKNLLNKECVKNFLRGYDSVRKLTPEELDIIPLSIYAQSRFHQLAVEKQILAGRKSDDIIDPRRLKVELKKYDFYEMTGHESKTPAPNLR